MTDTRGLARPSAGKRPVNERWWWFFVATLYLWSQVIGGAVDFVNGRPVERFAVVCAATLAFVMLPVFVWLRRHAQRKPERAAMQG